MAEKDMSMTRKGLPSCFVCERRVRKGVLYEEKHKGSKSLWRYAHGQCVELDSDVLWAAIPWTFESWIVMTIRLLDQIGEKKLFSGTNWRYVLECVAMDCVQLINEEGR